MGWDGMSAVRMMRMKEAPSAHPHPGKVSLLLDPTEPPGLPRDPSWFPRLFIHTEPPSPPAIPPT